MSRGLALMERIDYRDPVVVGKSVGIAVGHVHTEFS